MVLVELEKSFLVEGLLLFYEHKLLLVSLCLT